jgi:hypothetical protein
MPSHPEGAWERSVYRRLKDRAIHREARNPLLGDTGRHRFALASLYDTPGSGFSPH